MRKVFLSLAILLTAGIFSLNCFAQEKKICYVDIFKVFNDYQKTKNYEKDLEGKRKKQEAKLEKKKEAIDSMQSKISLLKEDRQEKEREKIIDAQVDYKKLERQIVLDLKKERDEKMKEIVEDINKVIERFAKNKGYDLIVSKNTVLYGNEAMDMTSQILAVANKEYGK